MIFIWQLLTNFKLEYLQSSKYLTLILLDDSCVKFDRNSTNFKGFRKSLLGPEEV